MAGVKQEAHICLKVDQHPTPTEGRGTTGWREGPCRVGGSLGGNMAASPTHWQWVWGLCQRHGGKRPLALTSSTPEPWTGTDSLGRIPGRAAVWGLKPVCSCFSGSFGLEHLVEPIKIKKPSGWRLGMPAHFPWHGRSCLREPAGINGTQLITNSS